MSDRLYSEVSVWRNSSSGRVLDRVVAAGPAVDKLVSDLVHAVRALNDLGINEVEIRSPDKGRGTLRAVWTEQPRRGDPASRPHRPEELGKDPSRLLG